MARRKIGHALDRFMGTLSVEEEAQILKDVEFLDEMDLQHARISSLLVEFEQEMGPVDPEVMEEVRAAWPLPENAE